MSDKTETAADTLCAPSVETHINPDHDIKKMMGLLQNCHGNIQKNIDALGGFHDTPITEMPPSAVKAKVLSDIEATVDELLRMLD